MPTCGAVGTSGLLVHGDVAMWQACRAIGLNILLTGAAMFAAWYVLQHVDDATGTWLTVVVASLATTLLVMTVMLGVFLVLPGWRRLGR